MEWGRLSFTEEGVRLIHEGLNWQPGRIAAR
jgi:hypothetical protein